MLDEDEIIEYTTDPELIYEKYQNFDVSLIATLESKFYTGTTLASEIQTKMNSQWAPHAGAFYSDPFRCTYESNTQRISINIIYVDLKFRICTAHDIENETLWNSTPVYNENDPQDCTEILKLESGISPYYTADTGYQHFINLSPIKIFIFIVLHYPIIEPYRQAVHLQLLKRFLYHQDSIQ